VQRNEDEPEDLNQQERSRLPASQPDGQAENVLLGGGSLYSTSSQQKHGPPEVGLGEDDKVVLTYRLALASMRRKRSQWRRRER
jgi:hypothetical protein